MRINGSDLFPLRDRLVVKTAAHQGISRMNKVLNEGLGFLFFLSLGKQLGCRFIVGIQELDLLAFGDTLLIFTTLKEFLRPFQVVADKRFSLELALGLFEKLLGTNIIGSQDQYRATVVSHRGKGPRRHARITAG